MLEKYVQREQVKLGRDWRKGERKTKGNFLFKLYFFLIGLVVSMILLMQRIRSPKKKERKMYSPSENYLVENQRNYNT